MLALGMGLWGQTAPYDVIIAGARVVDGSGSPWFLADIGIRGDSIAAVGALGNATASVRIDAKGMVVAPGFIDIHSHGRRGIAAVPTAENYMREGVTTIVEGPDGSSPLPIAPFLDGVRKMAVSVNFATMVGQGSIRQAIPRSQIFKLVNGKFVLRQD
jgi:N-acyl-D-aspartate/D-glutamate deacylase